MRWFYDEGYNYGDGLPGEPREIHGFVLRKAAEIHDHLTESGTVGEGHFHHPVAVNEEELHEVHTPDVIARLHDPSAIAIAIEVPEAELLPPEILWSSVVAPQLLAAGGTREALLAAASGEWAINLSGGFHHARRDLSHGFCLVNDVALAVARLRRDGLMRPTLIVDLDLHQGDGNASIFASALQRMAVDRVFQVETAAFNLPPRNDVAAARRQLAKRLFEPLPNNGAFGRQRVIRTRLGGVVWVDLRPSRGVNRHELALPDRRRVERKVVLSSLGLSVNALAADFSKDVEAARIAVRPRHVKVEQVPHRAEECRSMNLKDRLLTPRLSRSMSR